VDCTPLEAQWLGHVSGELFDLVAGVSMQHVPYRGGGPAINDLLGGMWMS
jgi:tripartite-type tricarboxylate transporter receptor subunit TctC